MGTKPGFSHGHKPAPQFEALTWLNPPEALACLDLLGIHWCGSDDRESSEPARRAASFSKSLSDLLSKIRGHLHRFPSLSVVMMAESLSANSAMNTEKLCSNGGVNGSPLLVSQIIAVLSSLAVTTQGCFSAKLA